jgi:hypothetical protein
MKFLFLCIAIFIFSCKDEDKLSKFDESIIITQSQELSVVDKIAMCNRVDGPFVGVGAVKSDQYKRFEKILQYDEEKLVELTNHLNPVVKVYAFNALVIKNCSKIFSIFEKNINDTTEFEELAGCIGLNKPVNFYFLQKLESLMSQDQKQKYTKEISACYSKEKWEQLQAY